MVEIFHRAKQEQEKHDKSFEEEQADGGEQNTNAHADSSGKAKPKADVKPKRRSNKGSETKGTNSLSEKVDDVVAAGSHVRVLSGPFTDFVGNLIQLDHKTGKVCARMSLYILKILKPTLLI